MADNSCRRPACTSGLPATYGFIMDGYENDETAVDVRYCAPCVALNITQDWLTKSEVLSLYKL